uniref:Uncharacterized protein n=1 Tax=Plectus sambesii TaxID=2011161 RepID=A0A914USU2_9BILA
MKGQFSSEGDSANGHQLKSDVFDRADKHTRSEERRIQSLLQKRELERKRQCLVSDTLKKIDSAEGTGLNKKIRFDSDSDNDDNDDNGRCAPTTATTSKSALANGSTSNGTITSASTSTSKTKKPALFDDDEEDDEQNGEDAEADGEMFALKPHFFGKKGAELMALEARYGGDDRFKLSNKFI